MKLSTKSRYALEGLFYMAIATLDRAASIKEIAAETQISPAYLEQIFFKLKQFGIIRTVRGARGGFLFEKPLSEITVGQIIRAVEGSLGAGQMRGVPLRMYQQGAGNLHQPPGMGGSL